MRRYRHAKMTGEGQSLATVVPLAPSKPGRKSSRSEQAKPAGPVAGANEIAVMAQCEAASKATEKPATVEQARTLAKILDDDDCKAMWPTTSRQLHVLLSSLTPPPGKSKGKLLQIQKMVNRRPHGADGGAVHRG